MRSINRNWITLDYIELFCHMHRQLVRCRVGEGELWISELGSHPSDLTADEIDRILTRSTQFEIRDFRDEDSEEGPDSYLLSRAEFESRLRRMVN